MNLPKSWIPITIITLLLIIGISGFIIFQNKKTVNRQNSNPPAKEIIKGKSGDCLLGDAEICKYAQAFIDNDIYRNGFTVKSILTDKTGKKTEGIIKIANNDKFELTSYEAGKETANIIYINQTVYTKDYTDNSWLKYENKQNIKSNQNEIDKMKVQMEQMMSGQDSRYSFQKISKQECPPFSCFKYQLLSTETPNVTQYIFFDDEQYLLRQIQTKQQDGYMIDITFDYESPVNIEKPSSVKELDSPNLSQPTGLDKQVDQKTIEEIKKQMQQQGN